MNSERNQSGLPPAVARAIEMTLFSQFEFMTIIILSLATVAMQY